MLADDLVGRIALEPFRPRIPVRNNAARVEHVDCIVDHAFDEHAGAPLAFAQRRLGLHTLCDVARNLAETDQIALFVLYSLQYGVAPKAAAVLADSPALGLVAAFATCCRH